jgi:hypothetical protein
MEKELNPRKRPGRPGESERVASAQDEDSTAGRVNQTTPLPTVLLSTSRKEREKWGHPHCS